MRQMLCVRGRDFPRPLARHDSVTDFADFARITRMQRGEPQVLALRNLRQGFLRNLRLKAFPASDAVAPC